MKRVVLVVPTFPRLSETFIVSQFLGLLAQSWDVHVVCQESTTQEWDQFPELAQSPDLKTRVHVSWPHRPRWLAGLLMPVAWLSGMTRNHRAVTHYLKNGWRRFGWQVLRNFYLDANILMLCPDVVHFEFGALAREKMYLRGLLGCRMIVSFRGYDLNFVGLESPNFYGPVWDTVDALHFLGKDLWRRALKRGCPPDKPHALIPPALVIEKFNPGTPDPSDALGSRQRPLRLVSVGRLEWKKGYEYALQAVRELVARGIHCDYRIIGGGEYLGALAFARHQLNLDQVVQFLGPQPPSEVKKQLLWGDIFLHAAVSEGFCNAVLEAQVMQLPVVCSDADGLSENVRDGESGFVVPRRNPQALANKMLILARDPELRRAMGGAGRQRVLQNFQLGDQIAAFDKLYQSVFHHP